jgi:anti-anti-sigma regulatory factor
LKSYNFKQLFFLKEEPDLPALEKELNDRIKEILNNVPIKNVVLDFSCINFIDSMGVNAIQQVRIFSMMI